MYNSNSKNDFPQRLTPVIIFTLPLSFLLINLSRYCCLCISTLFTSIISADIRNFFASHSQRLLLRQLNNLDLTKLICRKTLDFQRFLICCFQYFNCRSNKADAINTVELVRDVDAGELVAVMRTDAEPYPAVDVELRLPDSAKSCPILISRSEQHRKDAQEEEDIQPLLIHIITSAIK